MQLVGTEYEGGQNWPEITMWMRANEELYNANIMAEDIVAQLKQNLTWTSRSSRFRRATSRSSSSRTSGSWSSSAGGTTTRIPTTATATCSTAARPPGKRQAWSNAEFDDLVNQGKAEPDAAKRLAIYQQAEEIIQNDVGYMPLVYRVDNYVFKPYVKGVAVNTFGQLVPDGNIYVRMLTKAYIEGKTATT
jgi:ABC-type transport system substrate-binding protein